MNCKGSFGKSISVTLAVCIPTHCTPCLKTSLYFPLFSSEPIIQNASTVLYVVLLHDTNDVGYFLQNYFRHCFHGPYFANECLLSS